MLKVFIYLVTVVFHFSNGKSYKIPEKFTIGVASSAYQIEGGWNLDGKSPNIWDNVTHANPGFIQDRSNGDVACDSYHKWQDDIKLLKYLGVTHYRLSIAWTRILPTGYTNKINPDGILYYNDVINALIKNGIEPLVTIYHFDIPQVLQDLGGLASERIVTYFEDYARILFENFGDRVKKWITFNEPTTFCNLGYSASFAPAINSPGVGNYLCGKTLLVAHGRAYRLYEKYFKKAQQGKVGITINTFWFESKTNSNEDIEAQNRVLEMFFGWWMNPIFSENGNYPDVMIKRVEYVSKTQNFSESRLPAFTDNEIKIIRGSYDFLGLNYYTSKMVQSNLTTPYNPPSYNQDIGANIERIPSAETTITSWLQIYPKGLRFLLNYIKNKYDNPPVIITENGYPDSGGFNDQKRIDYIQNHLAEIVKAINDGCKVFGYTYWAFMDNFEWTSGYSIKYGVISVDFNSPNRTRAPKASAEFFKNLVKFRTVQSNS